MLNWMILRRYLKIVVQKWRELSEYFLNLLIENERLGWGEGMKEMNKVLMGVCKQLIGIIALQ